MIQDHKCGVVYNDPPEPPEGCPLCLARERLGRLPDEGGDFVGR